MIDWIKTAQGVATIAAAILDRGAWWNLGLPRLVFSPAARGAGSPRVETLEQFNRDTRLLVLDQAWWRANAAPPDLGFFGFNAILAASSLHRRWSVYGGAGHDRLHPSSRRGQDLQRFRYRLTSSWIYRCAAVHRKSDGPV